MMVTYITVTVTTSYNTEKNITSYSIQYSYNIRVMNNRLGFILFFSFLYFIFLSFSVIYVIVMITLSYDIREEYKYKVTSYYYQILSDFAS